MNKIQWGEVLWITTITILLWSILVFGSAHDLKNKSYLSHEYADNDTYVVPQSADMSLGGYNTIVSVKLIILYGTKDTTNSTVKWKIWEDEKYGRMINLQGITKVLNKEFEYYNYTFSENDLKMAVSIHKAQLNIFGNMSTPTLSSKIISSYSLITIEGAMMLLMKMKYGPNTGSAKF